MQSLAIYVQVPFCASKCSFCNFSSRVESHSIFNRYCDAVEQEIDRLPASFGVYGLAEEVLTLPVDTVYFGEERRRCSVWRDSGASSVPFTGAFKFKPPLNSRSN